jgi:hypothetical protein
MCKFSSKLLHLVLVVAQLSSDGDTSPYNTSICSSLDLIPKNIPSGRRPSTKFECQPLHTFSSRKTPTMPYLPQLLEVMGQRVNEQDKLDFLSPISTTTTSHTASPPLRKRRNSLQQASEPCRKAKVPRTQIAKQLTTTSFLFKSPLRLRQSSKIANIEVSLFLRILPPEIRIMIYGYLFHTQSGWVKYVNRHDEDGIYTPRFEPYVADFQDYPKHPMTAVLRTCKQIFHEGKPEFWKQNGLIMLPQSQDGVVTWTTLPGMKTFQNFMMHVPRVLINFHRYEWYNALGTAHLIFKDLKRLAEKGHLRAVTLVSTPSEERWCQWRDYTFSYRLVNGFRQSRESEARLFQVLRVLGSISKLEKRILLKAKEYDLVVMRDWLCGHCRREIESMLEEVNVAFRGELVLNKEVIYKDGVGTGVLRRLIEQAGRRHQQHGQVGEATAHDTDSDATDDEHL